MPPPPAIGSVRPKAKSEDEDASPAPASPSNDRGDGAEAADEDTQTGAWSPVAAEIAQDDGPDDGPSNPPTTSEPAPSLAIPSSSSASGLRVPSIDASSSASGLRAPSLDPSSASGLRAPSLGSAAVTGPADSAGSWPKTDGWDFDEEPGSSSVPAPPLPTLRTPARSPLPKVGRMPQLTPRPKTSPLVEPVATPAPREDSLFSDPPLGQDPASSLAAAASASLAAAAAKDVGAPLDATPSFETAPPLAAAPAAAPAWDHPQLLDAAPPAAGEAEVPSLDSAALLGTAVVMDPATEAAASVPRMPIPGMLRDGPAPKAVDFRAAPRVPRAQTAGAMAPLPGVVPPSFREDDPPRLKPGDTAAFMAQVAVELMEANKPASESLSGSSADVEAASAGEEVVTEVAAVPPKVVPMPVVAGAAPSAEGSRRGLWLGLAGLAAAIVLVVWMWGGKGGEPPSPVAAAPAATPPAPERTPAAVEPGVPAPEEPAVVDVAGTTSADDPLAAASDDETGEGTGGTGGEPALAASTGAAADGPEEPVEAASEPSASRKTTGKTRSPKTSSTASAKSEPKTEPKTDPPSPKKLLTQARSAYLAGKGSSAYSLASKSNRIEPSGEAAEVMALAACLMHDANKARSALKAVPLLRRGSVRTTCKNKHDVRVGL